MYSFLGHTLGSHPRDNIIENMGIAGSSIGGQFIFHSHVGGYEYLIQISFVNKPNNAVNPLGIIGHIKNTISPGVVAFQAETVEFKVTAGLGHFQHRLKGISSAVQVTHNHPAEVSACLI